MSFFDNKMRVSHTHLPESILKLGGIYEFEMSGAIFGLSLAKVITPGLPIAICIDNTAAAGTLVRGNCQTPPVRSLASLFWLMAAHFAFPVWVEQARSKSNVADPPSRARPRINDATVLIAPNYGAPRDSRPVVESRESIVRRQFAFNGEAGSSPEGLPCPEHQNAETF